VEGTSQPAAPTAQPFSGVALDGVSSFTGTQDTSTRSANFPGQTVTRTYTSIAQTSGLGTLTPTRPAPSRVICLKRLTDKFVLISTNPGDANPVPTIVGN
jgi:hypothetical protein